MEKRKKLIISCIYRTPGSDIQLFTDHIEQLNTNMGVKEVFICGDFNIDLLKAKWHRPTENVLNTLYSLAFYPKITRPTRITSHSSSLIDNIFTNVLKKT